MKKLSTFSNDPAEREQANRRIAELNVEHCPPEAKGYLTVIRMGEAMLALDARVQELEAEILSRNEKEAGASL